MKQNRRDFLTRSAAGALISTTCGYSGWSAGQNVFGGEDFQPTHPLYAPGEYHRIDAQQRTFHICACMEALEQYDGLIDCWKEAGIEDVWMCNWFYGHYAYPWDGFDSWSERLKEAGFRRHLIGVPFCHGGGALDPRDPDSFPNLPPKHWKIAKRWDGSENWGFSWHSPADTEGAEAIKFFYKKYGACDFFLDDDFRFASSPGVIGGCVCPECKAGFLKASGISENRWEEVLDDLRNNSDTPLLRAWVDYFCDRLLYCYNVYQNAVADVDVGIMVMYMGCERGGIRLDAYRDSLFRVGEGMFSDNWFDPPKNKSIELYSSLLHRRFCHPGRAFSETTVYPEKTLSAENMATKLSVSTISDVRNTCFMSGVRAIPPEYWPVIAPRMKKEREIHSRLLGQKAAGPFKHFYGLAARYLGGDNANSLFLTLGVPFEVCDEIPKDGWTFLSDADAAEMERGELKSAGSTCIARMNSGANRFIKVDEDFDSLFAFRRSILEKLQADNIPYVEEETPVVLAWYPGTKAMYLWNLLNEDLVLHLRMGGKRVAVELKALDSALVEESSFSET